MSSLPFAMNDWLLAELNVDELPHMNRLALTVTSHRAVINVATKFRQLQSLELHDGEYDDVTPAPLLFANPGLVKLRLRGFALEELCHQKNDLDNNSSSSSNVHFDSFTDPWDDNDDGGSIICALRRLRLLKELRLSTLEISPNCVRLFADVCPSLTTFELLPLEHSLLSGDICHLSVAMRRLEHLVVKYNFGASDAQNEELMSLFEQCDDAFPRLKTLVINSFTIVPDAFRGMLDRTRPYLSVSNNYWK